MEGKEKKLHLYSSSFKLRITTRIKKSSCVLKVLIYIYFLGDKKVRKGNRVDYLSISEPIAGAPGGLKITK